MKLSLIALLSVVSVSGWAQDSNSLNVDHNACHVRIFTAGIPRDTDKVFDSFYAGNGFGSEGFKVTDEITANLKTGGCEDIVVVAPDFSTAIVQKLQTSQDPAGPAIEGRTLFYSVDPEIPACTKIESKEIMWGCLKLRYTQFSGSGTNVMAAIADNAKSVRNMLAAQTTVMASVIQSAGLDSQVTRMKASLMVMARASEIPTLVLRANGYVPDLNSKTLWKDSNRADLNSLKIVQAILFLDSQDKVFVDMNVSASRKSEVVDRKTFHDPGWGTLMGYDLGDAVESAMKNAGYDYQLSWSTKK